VLSESGKHVLSSYTQCGTTDKLPQCGARGAQLPQSKGMRQEVPGPVKHGVSYHRCRRLDCPDDSSVVSAVEE
jgi:hypothetical protein